MSINNVYAEQYLNMVTTNLGGNCGIKLQVKGCDNNGKRDEDGNLTVEEVWVEWGKRKSGPVTG